MYSKDKQVEYYSLTKNWLEKGNVEISEIKSLREVLRYHEWKYSIENQPVVSDFEYDQLYKLLQGIEASHPNLITVDSPTQRVSSDISATFDAVPHIIPMLSLENSYDADDLKSFDQQVRKLTQLDLNDPISYSIEPKFDGGSIALIYENDVLVRAATRGNGQSGEEITPNAKAMSSIPLFAPFSKYGIVKAELRGEALISKETFTNLNQQRALNDEVLYANPRNAATGGLRTKDAMETRKRGIETFIFQLGYAVDADGNDKLGEIGSHYSLINLLGELGFKIPHEVMRKFDSIEEITAYCAKWQEIRDTYTYEIDGMVVKVDDLELQKKCGSTSHHPRWAVAFKFKAKQATTKLLSIEYQVGKVGSITPVAKVAPVQLAGVTVSSISLHNEEFISAKDLRIGDTVLIERAGDVIPYIVKSMADLRDGSELIVDFPKFCPRNDTGIEVALEQVEGESVWRCTACVCGAQNLQKMIYHISKDGMDIDGMGRSNLERFYDLGWVKDVSDIYNLDYVAISNLEGLGSKSAANLEESIEKAKNNPIHKVLQSLSIHHLGKRASKLIAEQIAHVCDLKEWTEDQFLNIKDIGPVVARNVSQYFAVPANVAMIRRMESLGVNMFQTEEDKPLEVASDGVFVDKSILFTGTLNKMGRKEAQEMAAKLGARNISAVSNKLDILVVGDNAGSKLEKAKEIGTVQILTEDEFLELVSQL